MVSNLANKPFDKKSPYFNRKLKNEKMIDLDEKSLLKLGQITQDDLSEKEKQKVLAQTSGLERAKQYFQKKLRLSLMLQKEQLINIVEEEDIKEFRDNQMLDKSSEEDDEEQSNHDQKLDQQIIHNQENQEQQQLDQQSSSVQINNSEEKNQISDEQLKNKQLQDSIKAQQYLLQVLDRNYLLSKTEEGKSPKKSTSKLVMMTQKHFSNLISLKNEDPQISQKKIKQNVTFNDENHLRSQSQTNPQQSKSLPRLSLYQTSSVLQRFQKYTDRLDSCINTMSCNESMQDVEKREKMKMKKLELKRLKEEKLKLSRTAKMLDKKVDSSLFRMPYLYKKETNAYFEENKLFPPSSILFYPSNLSFDLILITVQEKFMINERELQPFFEASNADNFDYEKEIERLKEARDKHQNQVKRQFLKKQKIREKKEKARRVNEEKKMMFIHQQKEEIKEENDEQNHNKSQDNIKSKKRKSLQLNPLSSRNKLNKTVLAIKTGKDSILKKNLNKFEVSTSKYSTSTFMKNHSVFSISKLPTKLQLSQSSNTSPKKSKIYMKSNQALPDFFVSSKVQNQNPFSQKPLLTFKSIEKLNQQLQEIQSEQDNQFLQTETTEFSLPQTPKIEQSKSQIQNAVGRNTNNSRLIQQHNQHSFYFPNMINSNISCQDEQDDSTDKNLNLTNQLLFSSFPMTTMKNQSVSNSPLNLVEQSQQQTSQQTPSQQQQQPPSRPQLQTQHTFRTQVTMRSMISPSQMTYNLSIPQLRSQLGTFYQHLMHYSDIAKSQRDRQLIARIDRSLKQQKKIQDMLQDYIYVYKYDKQENEELMQIVQESKVAVEDIKNDLINNEHKIDNDVTAKYEKAFIEKLKVWHVNELKQKSFQIQQIDQKVMKFQNKRKYNHAAFNSQQI